MKRLMILDGNSIVNRAFYGIRLLTNSEGLYTNAVYGFVNILFKYLDEEKPDYLCVAFDVSAPTFRHIQYEKYKAQRKGMPDELRQQMPLLKEVLSAMNISMLELEGYEADDIIGTISNYCDKNDTECVIITGDKDDLQLATEKTRIKLITTRTGNSETVDYVADTVKEKYGVTPAEFIDVKGLMGDPSDNIPGVAGIGEKTAFELIQRFKSIERIYQDLYTIDIKDSVRKKLAEGKEIAFISKTLATIDVNVPINYSIEDFLIKEYNVELLAPLFKRLNFNNFINRLKIEQAPKEEIKFEEVSLSGIDAIKNKIRKQKIMYYLLCKDAIALATNENDIAIASITTKDIADIFEDKSIKKIGHNVKGDIVKLNESGIKYNNLAFDTMIAAYIINPSRNNYDIAELSLEYLGYSVENTDEQRLSAIIGLHKYFDDKIHEYNQEQLFYEVELPLVEVLAAIQIYGIAVDKQKLTEFRDMLEVEINQLTADIYKCADFEFNINSPKQLGEVLFEKLKLPVIKKTKTGYSTDVEVLEKLKGSHEIIDMLMEFRHIVKLKSTYADGLLNVINPVTNRIHSSFNQTVTVTGRISSTEPNLQNIPIKTEMGREVRRMFTAGSDDYLLVDADYSQIELRVLAHIANDENMITAFKNNIDIHTQTASQVFGVPLNEGTSTMRGRAKAVNFGIVYGIGAFSLSQDLGITRSEAQKYIDNYLNTFSGVKQYMTNIVEQGTKDGFVTTLLNRRRYLPELKTGNFVTRSFGERVAMNTPIQGSAADIIKIAMVKVHKSLSENNMRSQLILQVHDELIVEAHIDELEEVKNILKTEMESAMSLLVPIDVDMNVGKTWYDAK